MEHGVVVTAAQLVSNWVVRVLFPEVCAGCGVMGVWLCADCLEMCRRIDADACCQRCGDPDSGWTFGCSRCRDWPAALAEARSVYAFAGPMRETVHRLKYRGEHARAAWCAREMAALLARIGWRPDVLIPTPLHPARLRQRGFNQSAKLAFGISNLTGWPVDEALVRQRATRPQVELGSAERAANVAGAFAAIRPLGGMSVLLIDDVLTTGATLADCARACRDAGAAQIRALTFAT